MESTQTLSDRITVIITPAGADTRDVLTCTHEVVRTAPRGTKILLLHGGPVQLPRSFSGAVSVTDLAGGDGTEQVAYEVAGDRDVLVLPATARVRGGAWITTALDRMAAAPTTTGVVRITGDHLFAFPRAVRTVDGPQVLWPDLPGVAGRRQRGLASRPSERTSDRGSDHQISAVLIVKDEEDVLDACLAAVGEFVDEVIVYDTGSTDGTLAIARERGATVVEGYWDDDFGAARNRAIAHATTEWVLVVDADEVIEGSVDDLRAHLAMPDAEAFIVVQTSPMREGAGSGHDVRTTRIFRPAQASYRGALHEQVVPRSGKGALRHSTSSPALRLVHSGYRIATMTGRDKVTRNLTISRAARERSLRGTALWAERTADYGRSLALAGRLDEAVTELNQLLTTPAAPGNMVQAGRVASPALIQLGRFDEAEKWLAAVSSYGESPGQVFTWRAALALQRGDLDAAGQHLMEALTGAGGAGGFDIWGSAFEPTHAHILLASLDLARGRPEEAVRRILSELERSPETVDVQVLFDILGSQGYTMRDLIEQSPAAFMDRMLREVTAMTAEIALPWFAVQSDMHPEDFRPVVAGCAVAANADWLSALDWSVRAREIGLSDLCPLRDLAENEGRALAERSLAWALLAEGFDDVAAVGHLLELLEGSVPDEREVALRLIHQHCPDLLRQLVGGVEETAPPELTTK